MRADPLAPEDDRPAWRRQAMLLARPPARWSTALLSGVLMASLLISPVPLSIIGAAKIAEFAFPALGLLLAFWLAVRAPARYIVFVLLVFMLAPGLRHFTDFYTAFSKTNPIELTPYLVVIPTAPRVLLHLLNRGFRSTIFFLMLLTITVALAVALLRGNIPEAILSYLRYLAPILFAVYIISYADQREHIRATVRRLLLIALPLMAGYAIWQFVDITPWDAYFMKSAPIDSIGYPVPFQVRVFGTMNSPGSLAAMLATSMLLTMPSVRGIGWVGFVAGLVAFMLTTQRAAMGGFCLGFLIMALMGRDRRMRGTLVMMAATVAVTLAVVLAVPGTAKKVSGSLDSVSSLNTDDSARARLAEYHNFLPWLDSLPMGRGMGWSKNPLVIIDSGLIEGFVSLGVPIGMMFFGTLVVVIITGGGVAMRSTDPEAQAEFAAEMFGYSLLPFGSQDVGEHGMFLYLAVGLLLARVSKRQLGGPSAMPLRERLTPHTGVAAR